MWRPENWIENISFEEVTKISPRLVSMMTESECKIYESGADAMLEALRKELVDLEQLRIFCKYADVPLTTNIISLKGVKGKVVFIPEEA